MKAAERGLSWPDVPDRRGPTTRTLRSAILRLRLAEFRAAEYLPTQDQRELTEAVDRLVEAVRGADTVPEITIPAPHWCPDCQAILPTLELTAEAPEWWPADQTPPFGVALVVALRDEDGDLYHDLAEYDPGGEAWRLVGDSLGAAPVQPVAWCFAPALPERPA